MASSLFNSPMKPQNNQIMQAIQQAKQMVNTPQMNMFKSLLGNQDPKQLFYTKCKEMGVNPDDILNLIK